MIDSYRFVKIFGRKYIPKMEEYIILAKTAGTDLYKNKVSIIFADRFFVVK